MRKMLLTAFAMLLFFCYSSAQVVTNFNNEQLISGKGRFGKGYKELIDFEVPARDITTLLKTEQQRNARSNDAKPFRLAEPVAIDLDIAKRMNWVADGNSEFGKFTIKVNGALSTSINFDRFYLPPGTEMFIYNRNGNMITGPVTEKENNPNKKWGSWIYKGEYLTIEIKTPALSRKLLSLHASNIAYGYKEVYRTETGGFGQSQSCNINVLCPLGNGWEAERNAVALILSDNGADLCSGAMVMNTCNTDRPFFLTANHCYDTDQGLQDVTAWRFTFQAWSSTCTPSQNSNGVTYNGSTLRANWNGTDFCLVELNTAPPANSGIHYAGWSRNTTGITTTTIIHHPEGDVMKISRDNGAPATASFGGAQCWWLTLDQGATEFGSSGSPYFDQNHRVIGQHFGVNDANLPICQRVNKFGGRFDLSWTGNGTNATRLSNWLDPSGSNAATTNTTNVSALAFPHGVSMSGAATLCSGTSQYSLGNVPLGAGISWTSSDDNIATVSGSNPATLTKMGDGVITLSAHITVCGYTRTISKTVEVGVPPPYSFNFNGFTYTPDNAPYYCIDGLADFEVSVINPVAGMSYWWTVYGGEFRFGQGTPDVGITTDYTSSDWLDVYVQPENSCGLGSTVILNIPYCPMFSAKAGHTYLISPNPASDLITIQTRPAGVTGRTKSQPGASGITEVRIFDNYGNLKKQARFAAGTKQAQMNVANLKTGVYVVEITTGQSRERQQVVIRK